MKKTLIYKSTFFIVIAIVFTTCCGSSIFAENETRRVYSKNREKSGQIALTFDDGPHPRYTQDILDILAKYGITATFFVIGVNATLYSDALKAIVDSGCEIGNHTFTHDDLKCACTDKIIKEISDCEKAISELTNTNPRIVRPPHGAYSKNLEEVANRLGYDVILWSIDTKDWAHTPANEIAQRVLSSLNDGDIILMHDYVSGKNTTRDALNVLIPEILKRGYKFVTVSELISGEA